jgi:hypothetical protein
MEIVAKTKDGVLIQATEDEAKEIIRSVAGETPKELHIGQKIPAIDYAGSITKVKTLKDCYAFRNLVEVSKQVTKEIDELKAALENAASVQI